MYDNWFCIHEPNYKMSRQTESCVRSQSFHLVLSYLCLFFINVVLLNISSHSKVCHFTRFSFTNQHITSCKVSVYNLLQTESYLIHLQWTLTLLWTYMGTKTRWNSRGKRKNIINNTLKCMRNILVSLWCGIRNKYCKLNSIFNFPLRRRRFLNFMIKPVVNRIVH